MAMIDGVVVLLASVSLVTGYVTNVAERKLTWMSSTLSQSNGAIKAVDGDSRADGVSHIIQTGAGQTTAWWKVDLQTPVQSARVILHFRTDYKYRRNGVHLYTSGKNSADPKEGNLCHTVTGRPDGTDIPDELNVTCSRTWRYLTVYTETNNDGGGVVLDFAEVQVWICMVGMYGPSCTKYCKSRLCKVPPRYARCDVTGSCPSGGCQDGWMGADCSTVCASGKYGANCTRDCSSRHCKVPSACDIISGACPADRCEDGWMGVDCTTACASGYYGANCRKHCCDRHCKEDSSCDRIQGRCEGGCAAGYNGTDCTEGCKPGTYGPDCSLCGHCDVTCNVVDGHCPGECLEGFTGDRCNVDVRASVAGIGIIGGAIGTAIGMVVMLLVVAGLFICLLKQGRLKRISSRGRKTGTRYTGRIPTPNVENPDQTELNDLTRERVEMSP